MSQLTTRMLAVGALTAALALTGKQRVSEATPPVPEQTVETLKEDAQWGIWSIRGRLLWYLEAVIDMTAAADVLPGINEAAHGWLSELRRRWPDSVPLGFYPAFATWRP